MGNMRFPAAMMAQQRHANTVIGRHDSGAFGFPGLGIRGAAISAIVSLLLLSAVIRCIWPMAVAHPLTPVRPEF